MSETEYFADEILNDIDGPDTLPFFWTFVVIFPIFLVVAWLSGKIISVWES